MKIFKATIITVLGSLALLSGCGDQLPTDIPDPYGVQGYLDLGWESYAAADYEQALDYFKVAIDLDVSGVEGFLGAGWAALFVEDYWRVADDYFYMAIQHDAGAFPIQQPNQTLIQDTSWTVFECVSPVLPDSVMEVIEALGETWYDWPQPGDTTEINPSILGDYLYGTGIFGTPPNPDYGPQYGNRRFTYRFHPADNSIISLFYALNSFTNREMHVDSIVPDVDGTWVYISVPLTSVDISGGDAQLTWISADNQVSITYATFNPTGAETQYTYDALVGIVMLQDVRGTNGNPLLGVAAAMGLDQLTGDYQFGQGKDYVGLENLSIVQVVGNGAVLGFAEEAFRYTLFMCTSMGYGTGLNPAGQTFVTDLMLVIVDMLNDVPPTA
jgi:hypothetical protein